jgi:hypothetical protein
MGMAMAHASEPSRGLLECTSVRTRAAADTVGDETLPSSRYLLLALALCSA